MKNVKKNRPSQMVARQLSVPYLRKFYPDIADKVVEISSYYFDVYQAVTGKPHPFVNSGGVDLIADALLDKSDFLGDCDIEDYRLMIDRHFDTNYHANCDYNIVHFFSGDIRDYLFYETLY